MLISDRYCFTIFVGVFNVKINLPDGLLSTARYLPSPHRDLRPSSTVIDAVIIHGISLPPGQFGTAYIENFFCDILDYTLHPYFATLTTLKVSAHLLIARTGEIIQFVPFAERAWHAGKSYLAGREHCNDFSIGIELEGTDDLPYEKIQYQKLTNVLHILMATYPAITRTRIVGHANIAPGRKTDPGPLFDWHYLDCLLMN